MFSIPSLDTGILIQKIRSGLETLSEIQSDALAGCSFELPLIEICSGSLRVEQPDAIAYFFGIQLSREDREFDDGWEAIDRYTTNLAQELTASVKQQAPDLTGSLIFCNDEEDGSYYLVYVDEPK